jgi:hypothetical protein
MFRRRKKEKSLNYILAFFFILWPAKQTNKQTYTFVKVRMSAFSNGETIASNSDSDRCQVLKSVRQQLRTWFTVWIHVISWEPIREVGNQIDEPIGVEGKNMSNTISEFKYRFQFKISFRQIHVIIISITPLIWL